MIEEDKISNREPLISTEDVRVSGYIRVCRDKLLIRELQQRTEKLITTEDHRFKLSQNFRGENSMRDIYFGYPGHHAGSITRAGEVFINYSGHPEQAFAADILRQICEKKGIKYTERAEYDETTNRLKEHAQKLVDITNRLEG